MGGSPLEVNPEETLAKEKSLEKRLGAFSSAVIAFSGGVDSTYLLYKAVEVIGTDRVLALTVESELTTLEEKVKAKEAAESINVKHKVIKLDLLSNPELRRNGPERCYICKKNIYGALLHLAGENSYSAVLDGSNADDTGEYRPGLQALKELKISSPLLEEGLGKEEIRYLSRQAGLATWNRPSAACLASRLPYGEELAPERLEKIAAAEEFLRQIGIANNLRVRCHGSLARIEVNREDFDLLLGSRKEIAIKLRSLGFIYSTLDLDGFQSGSMDRALD